MQGTVAQVSVVSTSGRGHTPEELAKLAVDKIIHISDDAAPEIAAQARAFRDKINNVMVYYMKQAIASDRTTVYNMLQEAGQPVLAETIRRL